MAGGAREFFERPGVLPIAIVGVLAMVAVGKLAARATPRRPPAPRAGTVISGAPRAVGVVIYTTTWCGYCRAAKEWLDANSIRYQERDIETSEEAARAMRAINPRGGVPTIDVEGEVLVGFGAPHLRAAIDRAAARRAR